MISYSRLKARHVPPGSGYGLLLFACLCIPISPSRQDETLTLLSGIDGRVSDIVGKYLRVDS